MIYANVISLDALYAHGENAAPVSSVHKVSAGQAILVTFVFENGLSNALYKKSTAWMFVTKPIIILYARAKAIYPQSSSPFVKPNIW